MKRNKEYISKGELAQAYAPDLTPKAALNRLNLWINTNKKLKKALRRAGYKGTEKKISKKFFALIIRHLGAP